jgi:hypothetical protein
MFEEFIAAILEERRLDREEGRVGEQENSR